jgi:DNA-binding NtrC family response regulator
VPALVTHFIHKFNLLHSREITGIHQDALDALKKYRWEGNIRELENAVERAFVMELSPKITLRSLPEQITGLMPVDAMSAIPATQELIAEQLDMEIDSGDLSIAGIDFQVEKEEFERQFIISALKRFNGRINQTVAHANIPKNTLLRKIRKYDIKPWEYGCGEEQFKDSDMHPDETI